MAEKATIRRLKPKCWAVVGKDSAIRAKFERPTAEAARSAAQAMADRLNAEAAAPAEEKK